MTPNGVIYRPLHGVDIHRGQSCGATGVNIAGAQRGHSGYIIGAHGQVPGHAIPCHVNIEGIGPIIGRSVAEWFTNASNCALLARLQKYLKITKVSAPSKGLLTGQTVVITGTLPTLSREEAEARVRRAGGKTASSVSAKTSFVVAGTDPGSKLTRAEQLDVSVIDESEFLKKLSA